MSQKFFCDSWHLYALSLKIKFSSYIHWDPLAPKFLVWGLKTTKCKETKMSQKGKFSCSGNFTNTTKSLPGPWWCCADGAKWNQAISERTGGRQCDSVDGWHRGEEAELRPQAVKCSGECNKWTRVRGLKDKRQEKPFRQRRQRKGYQKNLSLMPPGRKRRKRKVNESTEGVKSQERAQRNREEWAKGKKGNEKKSRRSKEVGKQPERKLERRGKQGDADRDNNSQVPQNPKQSKEGAAGRAPFLARCQPPRLCWHAVHWEAWCHQGPSGGVWQGSRTPSLSSQSQD